jgi:glycine/D-amino acid oxidase-like deaminating enzyme
MSPQLECVESHADLPKEVDVVVVGGGIVGCAAALYLRRAGASVAVLEKGRIGGEQSSRNWGWCRQQGRDLSELPLATRSLELWQRLQNETQINFGFRQTGVLFVTKDPAELASWERWHDAARDQQVRSNLLSPAEARTMTPGTDEQWLGGLYTPSDGVAEPALAAPALAIAARELGATIHERCAVRGFETVGGRATIVVTERGIVRAGAILCAGGIWSSTFLKRHGVQLPQLHVNASVLRTEPVPTGAVPAAVATPTVCLRARLDGGLTVAYGGRGTFDLTPDAFRYMRMFWSTYKQRGKKLKVRLGKPFLNALLARRQWSLDEPTFFEEEAVRVWDPEPDREMLQSALADLQRMFPAVRNVKAKETWGGSIDSMPDGLPVISAAPHIPGLYLATGFSGHGFGVGPGAGHLAADLILGRAPLVDPKPFRYERFWEGAVRPPDSRL